MSSPWTLLQVVTQFQATGNRPCHQVPINDHLATCAAACGRAAACGLHVLYMRHWEHGGIPLRRPLAQPLRCPATLFQVPISTQRETHLVRLVSRHGRLRRLHPDRAICSVPLCAGDALAAAAPARAGLRVVRIPHCSRKQASVIRCACHAPSALCPKTDTTLRRLEEMGWYGLARAVEACVQPVGLTRWLDAGLHALGRRGRRCLVRLVSRAQLGLQALPLVHRVGQLRVRVRKLPA